MGAGLGSAFYHLVGRRRRLALENLRLSLGDQLSPEEIVRVAKESFANHGRGLAELLRFPVLDSAALLAMVQLEGIEHFQTALSQGRGVLALGAHLGNFDIVATVMAAKGYPGDYEKGSEIKGLSALPEDSANMVFHAGTSSAHQAIRSVVSRIEGSTGKR